jgi:hypothetical protein
MRAARDSSPFQELPIEQKSAAGARMAIHARTEIDQESRVVRIR